MKIIVCLLAIFVIGNCQNEFIDEAQDVEENSDLQERSEDEAQYFDPKELSDIEERSDDIDEAEDIDDAEDMEDREKRSETDEDEETKDMEEESTIEKRSAGAKDNIKYIVALGTLKLLSGQLRKAERYSEYLRNVCAQNSNFIPYGNCRGCHRSCKPVVFNPRRGCGCASVCKADKEKFEKLCKLDRCEIRVIKKLIKVAKKDARKAKGPGRI